MLHNNLKNYAFVVLKFPLTIFVLTLFAWILSTSIQSHTEAMHDEYYNDTNALKGRLNTLNNQLIKAEQDLKTWNEQLNMKYSRRAGLDLDGAKKIIESLRISHNIQDVNVSLTNPAKRDDIPNLDFIDLTYSKVVINFKAYTDRDVISFVQGLQSELPGNVTLNSLNLVAESVIDKHVLLTDSRTGATSIKPVITAKLEFLWQNIDDKIKAERKP